MTKKKISSKEFLGLLDDQEMSNEKAAFSPSKTSASKKPPNAGRTSKRQPLKFGKYTLGPAQTEFVNFVVNKGKELQDHLLTVAETKGIKGRAEKTLEIVWAGVQSWRKSRAKNR